MQVAGASADGKSGTGWLRAGAWCILRRAKMEEVTDLSETRLAWRERLPSAMKDHRAAAQLAREANGRGEHMLALCVADRALRQLSLVSDPRDSLPLRTEMALALARSGSAEEAMEVLGDSAVAIAEDGETLGVKGRLYKNSADATASPEEALRQRQRALEFYARGFAVSQSPYCGINTAVLSALTGDLPRARRTAGKVLELRPEEDRLWAVATVACAQMILGEAERARQALCQANRAGSLRRSDLAVVRRDVRRLAAVLHGDGSHYDNCFDPAAVAVFHARGEKLGTGDEVELVRWLQDHHVVCAWSAAASGEESKFLERAAVLGVETCIVLPEAQPREHARKAVGRAALVDFLSEEAADLQAAEDLARRVAMARGMARAASWDAPLLPVSVGSPPASWAGLSQEVFTLGGANADGFPSHAVGNAMRAMLCVWPLRNQGHHPGGLPDPRAVWEKHPARCGTPDGGIGPYLFAWPSMAEAGRAAAVLQRELTGGAVQGAFTFLLHASDRGQVDERLGGWAKRIYPGRLLATGRFADLAALEANRDFDVCYVGMLDCRAEPLGIRLYQIHQRNNGVAKG